jgi:ATP-dependent Lhr-like helicase
MGATRDTMDTTQTLTLLPEPFARWFAARGWSARAHQLDMIAAAQDGVDALLIAPTGGGKTLAGFLPSLIEISSENRIGKRLHTLYISPLKALAVDIARNLSAPIAEMDLPVRVETRTGDTPPARRKRQREDPPDILILTPEQLALMISGEGAPLLFSDLRRIIIDEAHALMPGKRGDLLVLALGALQQWAPRAQRVGLSATVADADGLARWIAPGAPEGARIVRGVSGTAPRIDVLDSGARIPWAGHMGRHAIEEIYRAIGPAKTALLFVNTRAQAEFVFQTLWSVNDAGYAIALHHGSLDVAQRRKVEAAMAEGRLKAVVCTSTLDLGIDWGDVDLVIQLGAPKGAARLVQRIGRSNHRMDEASLALLVPTNRFEVFECRAASLAVAEGALDGPPSRTGALDVLAQHIMGRACGAPFEANQLYREIRATAPYADLSWESFERVLGFVSDGGYALKTYDRFKRIIKGRDGLWRARNADMERRHRMNVGTIVGTDMIAVRFAATRGALRGGGPKLGEVEEWFIDQLVPGDTFLFAGQILRFEGLTDTAALVTRSSSQTPKIPSYNGGKFPLSTFLAARVRAMIHDRAGWTHLPTQIREWMDVQDRVSCIPQQDELLVETFPRGGRFYLVLYPFEGRLAHQTLGMLLTRRLERAGLLPLGFVASEYALAIWAARDLSGVDLQALLHQDMLGDDLEEWLDESALMKRTFRQCALISGLIEKRMPGHERSGRQVTFSADLIYDVLRSHEPDHILLLATRADAAEGLLDIRRLGDMLARVKNKIRSVHLDRVSPFAVPVMLEIGREPVRGAADEALLADAASALLRDAGLSSERGVG